MLAVLLMLASLAVADEGPTVAPSLVAQRGGRWLVEASGIGWTPGTTVAVYLEEVRPDPRGGEPIVGLRYAGDARISWVGPDLIELLPERPEVVAAGTGVRLGEPLGAEPTPAWVPPGPHPVAVVESAPEPVAPPREASEPFEPAWTRAVSGEALGRLTDEPGLPQALVVEGGFTGDGYDTGAAWGAVGWQLRPPVGPGQIEVRLEGLRGERWVEGKGDEPYATEPAVGYWLLGRVDTAGVGLGVYGVLGAGVDDEGLAFALGAGVRTGHPDRTRLELGWDGRGPMGSRFVLDGRVALSDQVRVGLRSRVGTLPTHRGDFLQWRADGALVVDAVVRERWRFQGAVGAGGYDLPWRDLGLVTDGRVEVRW